MAKILVKLDVGDLVDRLFVPPELDRHIGISNLYQDAVKLTVLDKRRFSPPIESMEDRVQNLKNTLETFGVSWSLINWLIAAGFRSTALVALVDVAVLARDLEMTRNDYINLTTMLKMVRCSPLEPLYSLNRLAHHNLQSKPGSGLPQYLDLATKARPRFHAKPQINKFYRMMTKVTFATTNDRMFGRQAGSRGLEHHVESPAAVMFIPYTNRSKEVPHPFILCPRRRTELESTDSDASSGSSNSLNGELPDYNHNQPLGERLRKGGRWSCPFLNCHAWFDDLNQHLFHSHNGYIIDAKAKKFVNADTDGVFYKYRAEQLCQLGHVDLSVEAAIMNPQYIWWGPKCFDCRGSKFFLVLFKWASHHDPWLLFSVVANVDEDTARTLFTNVDVLSPSSKQRILKKHFRGRVLSLADPQSSPDNLVSSNLDILYHRFSDLNDYIFPDGKIRFRLGIHRSKNNI